jgi:ABC-type nitrate/sulfonate/bicarbonate transport system ATPase subunit
MSPRAAEKIRIANVRKAFPSLHGQGADVVALEDINLTFGDGEFACLLGPSGCGKSTLLNLVAGFERPTAGEVWSDGQPVRDPGPNRAVVFQEPALFPWLTVWDNIVAGPRARAIDASRFEPLARTYVELMGLRGFERHYPAQLSGGMRQRVAIARVLVLEPDVLLMDEPFGSLDAQTRSLMQELLLRVWEQSHRTVVFITHDVDEAVFLADVTYVMTARPGRIKRQALVDLPRPRTIDMLTSPAFTAIKREILELIREESIRAVSLESLEVRPGDMPR